MNGNPKAASTQESIAFHFDFADATDPAERERLLMEELRRTQSALAEADIEIKQKQRALASQESVCNDPNAESLEAIREGDAFLRSGKEGCFTNGADLIAAAMA